MYIHIYNITFLYYILIFYSLEENGSAASMLTQILCLTPLNNPPPHPQPPLL